MIEFLNLALTWFLVGLIWIVQIVHYPTFRLFDEKTFGDFHNFHTKSITKIVAPTMIFEGILGGYLAFADRFSFEYFVAFAAIGVIWASTFFIQVPLHGKLGQKFDKNDIEKLIKTNWIRTVVWTLKGVWILSLF